MQKSIRLIAISVLVAAASLSITLGGVSSLPPSDAVSRWSAEGNADDSIDGNHGILENGAGFDAGIVGQAFILNGVDQAVKIPYNANMSTNSLSISVWVKPRSPVDDAIGQEVIIAQANGHAQLLLRPSSPGALRPSFQFKAVNSTFPGVESAITLPIGQWSHVAVTYDGTTTRIYVNGALAGEAVPGVDPVAATNCPYYFGGFTVLPMSAGCSTSDTPDYQFLDSLIDEPQYFARALTGTEVREIFQAVVGLTQGDVDCSGNVNSVDALKVLRNTAALPVTQKEPCPDIASQLGKPWADVDCSNGVNSVDALKLLRYVAALSVQQIEPCDDVGASITP